MSEMSASEHEVRARLAEREHANKEWREKSNKESMVVNEQRMKLSALENQVQSAEQRLTKFKDAVMIVVRELARE
jgi:Fe-S cluster biosynthesis and repair protein YggX